MDQMKIGAYLKELRKEKNLAQEQIAEKFGVSQRSVSRWENGYTMPDISILIELADYYDVDLREILNGERKANNMDADLKETLVMVADYTSEEKKETCHLSVFDDLDLHCGIWNPGTYQRVPFDQRKYYLGYNSNFLFCYWSHICYILLCQSASADRKDRQEVP